MPSWSKSVYSSLLSLLYSLYRALWSTKYIGFDPLMTVLAMLAMQGHHFICCYSFCHIKYDRS